MEEDEKLLKLELTYAELDYIFHLLGKQPFEEVYELIGNINQQVNEQAEGTDSPNAE